MTMSDAFDAADYGLSEQLGNAAERALRLAADALLDNENPGVALQWLRLQQQLEKVRLLSGIPVGEDLEALSAHGVISADTQLIEIF